MQPPFRTHRYAAAQRSPCTQFAVLSPPCLHCRPNPATYFECTHYSSRLFPRLLAPMGQHPADLVVLTYNILCPVYKRLGAEHAGLRRESESPALWRRRIANVIAEIRDCRPVPDIICLQEFWFAPECAQLFRDAFSSTYSFALAKRPGKEDGLATLVRKRSPAFAPDESGIVTPHHVRDFSLLPASDRVGLLVALRLASPTLGPKSVPQPFGTPPRELVVVNTHLTFPHGKILDRLRLEQARTISRTVEQFVTASCESPAGCDVLVMGDFNGEPKGRVCGHMRHAGYTSCLAEVWGCKASPATHRNHLGQSVFVDHVFMRRFLPNGDTTAATPCPNIREKQARKLHLRFLRGSRASNDRSIRPIASCQLLSTGARDIATPALRERPTFLRASFLRGRRLRVTEGATDLAAAELDVGANHESNANHVDDDACSSTSEESVQSATLTRLESSATGSTVHTLLRNSQMSVSMSALESDVGALGCTVDPIQARVLPDSIPSDTWPTQPRCSDHRPICVAFRYSWSVVSVCNVPPFDNVFEKMKTPSNPAETLTNGEY